MLNFNSLKPSIFKRKELQFYLWAQFNNMTYKEKIPNVNYLEEGIKNYVHLRA